MAYQVHVPSRGVPPVGAHVDAFWSFEGKGTPHRVLPDGCADILFHLGTGTAVVVGAMSRAEVVEAPPGSRVFGVRFRPGRAALVIDARASDLRDREAPLEAFLGRRAAALVDAVEAASSDGLRADAVARFVGDPSFRVRAVDARVARAVELLERSQGRMPVAAVAVAVGVGERQLERLFAERVGIRPKLFARVARVTAALGLSRARAVTSNAEIAAAAGYADEAHWIRECRALVGTTPASYLRQADVGFVQSSPEASR